MSDLPTGDPTYTGAVTVQRNVDPRSVGYEFPTETLIRIAREDWPLATSIHIVSFDGTVEGGFVALHCEVEAVNRVNRAGQKCAAIYGRHFWPFPAGLTFP